MIDKKSIKKVIEKHPDRHDIKFLLGLFGEITSVQKKNPLVAGRCFGLSIAGSSVFGFDFDEKGPCIGVPKPLYTQSMKMRWKRATYREGFPWLFLCYESEGKGIGGEESVRLFVSPGRLQALKGFNQIKMMPISSDGKSIGDKSFVIDLVNIKPTKRRQRS